MRNSENSHVIINILADIEVDVDFSHEEPDLQTKLPKY